MSDWSWERTIERTAEVEEVNSGARAPTTNQQISGVTGTPPALVRSLGINKMPRTTHKTNSPNIFFNRSEASRTVKYYKIINELLRKVAEYL